jgi:hypothetical protein
MDEYPAQVPWNSRPNENPGRLRSLVISEWADRAAERAVIVCGSGRSGTSILSVLLASFAEAELCYEPTVLTALLAAEDRVDSSTFRLLWTSYVFPVVVLDSLAGRGLNLQRHDESSSFRTLDKLEIDVRLSRGWGLTDLLPRAARSVAVVKMPDVVGQVGRIRSEFPGTRLVVTGREPVRTLTSLITRNWFADLAGAPPATTSPVFIADGTRVPFWVEDASVDDFLSATPEDRAAMYYTWVTERSAEQAPNAVFADYQDLVEAPGVFVRKCAESLDMGFGSQTERLCSQISERPVPTGNLVLDRIRPQLLARCFDAWNTWKSVASL